MGSCGDCLIKYLLPLSEYLWAAMVIFLTNLNYIHQTEKSSLMYPVWKFHTPQQVYFGILAAGGGVQFLLMVYCYRRGIKSCGETVIEALIVIPGYLSGIAQVLFIKYPDNISYQPMSVFCALISFLFVYLQKMIQYGDKVKEKRQTEMVSFESSQTIA